MRIFAEVADEFADICGYLREFADLYGFLRIFADFYGFLRILADFADICGFLRKLRIYLRISADFCGRTLETSTFNMLTMTFTNVTTPPSKPCILEPLYTSDSKKD